MVSIHRPLGYGPSTLPLRHSACTTITKSIFTLNPYSKKYECYIQTKALHKLPYQNKYFLSNAHVFLYEHIIVIQAC